MLITIGTNLKLPLSTTYVTFMVAMGSSSLKMLFLWCRKRKL
jgi:hypothetical protein